MAVLDEPEVLIENAETHEQYQEWDDEHRADSSTVRRIGQCIDLPGAAPFNIVVSTGKGFDWLSCSGLSVLIDFDRGNEINRYEVVLERPSANTTDVSTINTYRIDSLVLPGPSADKIRSVRFKFAELREDTEVSENTVSTKVERISPHQGTIRVEVSRVNITGYTTKNVTFGEPLLVRRAPKIHLQEHGIDFEIVLVEAGAADFFADRSLRLRSSGDKTTFVFKYRKEMSYTRVEYDVVLQAPRLDSPDSAAVVVPFQNTRSWAYYEQNLSRRQSFEGMAPDTTARSGSYARSDREYTASKITPLKLKTMVGTRTVDEFGTALTQSGLNATPTFGSRTGAQAADETGTVSAPTPQSVPKVRRSCDSMAGAWADDDSGPAFMPSVEPDSDYTPAIETRSGPPTADEHDPTQPMQVDAAAQTETMVPPAIRNLEIAVQVQAREDRFAMDALRRERDMAVQRERSAAHDKDRAISINKTRLMSEMQRQLEKAREGEKRAQETCREAVEREKAARAELDEAELRQEQSPQALATAIITAVKDNTQPKSKKRRLDGDEIGDPRTSCVREQLGGKMVLERIETKPVLEGV